MSLNVLRKVVAAHETFSTFRTLEAFLSSMSSSMSLHQHEKSGLVNRKIIKEEVKFYLKFIWSCKAFTTIIPRTNKWSITWVPSQVSTQMRRFTINFSTALMVADVYFPFVLTNPLNNIEVKIKIFARYKHLTILTVSLHHLCNSDKCMLHDEDEV